MKTTVLVTEPTDPEAIESAALDLIVRSAEEATGSRAFRAALQYLAGILHVEGALGGLVWADAKLVAALISYDAVMVDDCVRSLRRRATAVAGGWWAAPGWHDAAGVARALNIAADVIEGM